MRKLKSLWLSIPRPLRALLNILAILLLLIVFYVSIGAPALNEEHAFRREEKANLIGPSTILSSSEVLYFDYDHMILAETDEGVITYVSDDVWSGSFNYHEKTGDITVVSAPKGPFFWGMDNLMTYLPIYVVEDHPEAVRAELDLHIAGTLAHNLNGEKLVEELDQHFYLKAERNDEGFFSFLLRLEFLDPYDQYGRETNATHGADGYAADLLAMTFTNSYWNCTTPAGSAVITANVRLYDENDALIVTRTLTLRDDEA